MLSATFTISVVLFVAQGVLLSLYLYLKWHHGHWKKRGLITAQPLTLLGSYPNVILRRKNAVYDIQNIYDKYKNSHQAVGTFLTRLPQVLILDPQLGNVVLTTKFSHFRDSLPAELAKGACNEKYVHRNPFFVSGDSWKTYRTDAQGGLAPSRLKKAYSIWQSGGQKLLNFIGLHSVKHGALIEARDLAHRFTADMMCDFIWGIDANALTYGSSSPNPIMENATKWVNYAFSQLIAYYATLAAPFVRRLFSMRFFPKDTDEFFSKLTTQAIDVRCKSPAHSTRADYLNYLLQLRDLKNLCHDDLVGHSLTVMLNGYETTAEALLHLLHHVTENPRVQQKLRNEIFPSRDATEDISFEELNNLSYLDQCVYESLRISSLIPHYSKVCVKPLDLELTDGKQFRFESGDMVMVPAYQYHYDSNYFPEPSTFRPERFDNGAHLELMKRGVLIPFGSGPRICMGQRLALLTMKTALAHILREYELCSVGQEIKMTTDSGFVITFACDVNIEFRKLPARFSS